MQRRHAFTLIELLVVISIIALLIALLLPALSGARVAAQQLASNTQIRGVHQGMVVFAQENKTGGGDGYFPGLTADGEDLAARPTGADTFRIAGPGGRNFGSTKHRYALMLNGGFVAPGSIASPGDDGVIIKASGVIDSTQFSYCMSQLGRDNGGNVAGSIGYRFATSPFRQGDLGRIAEWKETLSSSAVVMSDMNTGTNITAPSSWWTEQYSGTWVGGVARNDNSVSTEDSNIIPRTQNHGYAEITNDNLFDNNHSFGGDAMMVLGRVGWGSHQAADHVRR